VKKKKKNQTQITGEYINTGNTGTVVVRVRYLCTGEVKHHCHTAAAAAAASSSSSDLAHT